MAQNTIRRLAASVLGAGESKIWFDPSEREKISEALTRDDVRALVKEGKIKAKPTRGVCRVRARKKQEGKRKGRHSGHGSRKGTRKARVDYKEQWIAKVRSQRKILATLMDSGVLERSSYKTLYLRVKGNSFKGKKNLINYIKENKLVTDENLNKALAPAPRKTK
ncbi:MAG: 50S ribosomal protein L19e [Candidatus Micrarchaeota archaeon]